jgi:multiple sugar transport system permease protein/raffinose/stachyose/melibiose transport system permease protein
MAGLDPAPRCEDLRPSDRGPRVKPGDDAGGVSITAGLEPKDHVRRDDPPHFVNLPILAPVAAPGQGVPLPSTSGRASARPRPAPPHGAIVAFLLPALVLYAALTAYPFFRPLWTVFIACLPRREVLSASTTTRRSPADEFFWRAVRNTQSGRRTSPLFEVSIALLLALALYAKCRARASFRVAWFTPVLMSYVVVGILFVWIYNYDWGR